MDVGSKFTVSLRGQSTRAFLVGAGESEDDGDKDDMLLLLLLLLRRDLDPPTVECSTITKNQTSSRHRPKVRTTGPTS